jgi:hypothetical protein
VTDLLSAVSPVLAGWTTPQDPTGLSSPIGRIAVLVGLLASLVLLLRWWWQSRRRR